MLTTTCHWHKYLTSLKDVVLVPVSHIWQKRVCISVYKIQKYRHTCLTCSLGCTFPIPLLALQSAHVPQFQLYVLYSEESTCVPPIWDQSNASSCVLQLTSSCASSCDESCIYTSNRTALLDKDVSLQSGVATESKLTAETSALPTANGGTGAGKLNGGTCFGAPVGK
jgi:hypothetical protein